MTVRRRLDYSTPMTTTAARDPRFLPGAELERLVGIVERITFHNPETGWTVLKVAPFREPGRLVSVLIHQAKVFAGATMEFWGSFSQHPAHGEQFKAIRAVEKKPATAAALEKYLGSGLIKGVGPAIAKRIVRHFAGRTLDVFESQLEELLEVPGIAEKKLETIRRSWTEHRAIRDVMMFLQGYGISTLFATKIFKTYGDRAIDIVSKNPYRLAHDIYGIGFFSADRIATAMGFERDGVPRLEAGIKHVLAASRDAGHCFLTDEQIIRAIPDLLREAIAPERVKTVLSDLCANDEVKVRTLEREGREMSCFYSRGLYFDEMTTAKRVLELTSARVSVDPRRVGAWIERYSAKHELTLSDEQRDAVRGIAASAFAVLTGGPGCGKTTTTRVLVQLLVAMRKRVLLAAPTGRAAQRMSEVIGSDASTIHRLLGWMPAKAAFQHDEQRPLTCDFLIVDETSMLDISLAASLLRAVPRGAQVLFIGDPDQLPAVGAGDVLADVLRTAAIPRFCLTKVFRQAEASSITRFAHEINRGSVPRIVSPIARPSAFAEGHDCLFVDADEATKEQIHFIQRVRAAVEQARASAQGTLVKLQEEWIGRIRAKDAGVDVDLLYRPDGVDEASVKAPVLTIPEKLRHVDLTKLVQAERGSKRSAQRAEGERRPMAEASGGEVARIDELLHVLKNVHPWSSIHRGMTATETVARLCLETIPRWLGERCEVQVLTPQVRGTLGTIALNQHLQRVANPESREKRQLEIGEKVLRVGDRVIQTRNNYDLSVFNGDIGHVVEVNTEEKTCEVSFSGGGHRRVVFEKDALSELSLSYAITIHKSQGSEFEAVIIPVLGQHFNMLFRNLIYTALTRAKKLAVLVGTEERSPWQSTAPTPEGARLR